MPTPNAEIGRSPAAAAAAVLGAWARGLTPDRDIGTAEWIADNLVVPDGPLAGQRYDMNRTPYMREILDTLDDPDVNFVAVRKSSQVGFTQAAIGWVGKKIDTAPADGMIIFPTLSLVQDYNRKKLQPTIEATPALKRKVSDQKSRSAEGSTSLSKRFPGGWLTLTGANSAADLRSKTTQFQCRDEIDEWPPDLAGQGDPMVMADARLTSFHATGDWKVLCGSTPTIKVAGEKSRRAGSRIDALFEAGDQRYWEVPCPHCGAFQLIEFGGRDSKHGLKFNSKGWPYHAHYVCAANSCVIEHDEKAGMVCGGRWVAHNPGAGRHPSFHIDALMSLFTTWDKIAEEFLKAKDDRQALKGFTNLVLGRSWEERGDAPDHELLILRREDYPAGTIPAGALVLTGGADVQRDGIYFEIAGWGIDGQSWSIDCGFLEGDPSNRRNAVWEALEARMARPLTKEGGGKFPVDLYGVDSGYLTNTVYEFCRRQARARATKGDDGWHKAAIATAPTQQQISFGGKRRGVRLWHVGTWPLKAQLYATLRLEGVKDGAEKYPAGFCHFSTEVNDENFFKQLTAEHLSEEMRAGRMRMRWIESGPNHYLDCRIINMAMRAALGIDRWTTEQWGRLAAERGRNTAEQQDLLDRERELTGGPASPARPSGRTIRRMVRR